MEIQSMNMQQKLELITLASKVCEEKEIIVQAVASESQSVGLGSQMDAAICTAIRILIALDSDPKNDGLMPVPNNGIRWRHRGE